MRRCLLELFVGETIFGSLLAMVLVGTTFLGMTAFGGDRCVDFNQSPCTPNCSSTGPRHQYTVSCTYRNNYRCVDAGSTNFVYTLKKLPNEITIYNNADCNNSTTAPETIDDLPHTFSNQITPKTITELPVDLKIMGHICAYDEHTNTCTWGD